MNSTASRPTTGQCSNRSRAYFRTAREPAIRRHGRSCAPSRNAFAPSMQSAISCAALRGRSRLLLILEDLHTADAASLILTHFIVREVGDASIVLVGTYRPGELDREPSTPRLFGKLLRRNARAYARWIVGSEYPPADPSLALGSRGRRSRRRPCPSCHRGQSVVRGRGRAPSDHRASGVGHAEYRGAACSRAHRRSFARKVRPARSDGTRRCCRSPRSSAGSSSCLCCASSPRSKKASSRGRSATGARAQDHRSLCRARWGFTSSLTSCSGTCSTRAFEISRRAELHRRVGELIESFADEHGATGRPACASLLARLARRRFTAKPPSTRSSPANRRSIRSRSRRRRLHFGRALEALALRAWDRGTDV